MKKFAVLMGVLLIAGIVAWQFRDSPARDEAKRLLDDSTRVITLQGELIGYRTAARTRGWLGIPFAQPPVGNLRWRAPVRLAEKRDSPREALEVGPVCPQIGTVLSSSPREDFGKIVGSEDCLYLNVWSPADAQPGSLPVMFWIHGGGNSIGHGGSRSYDGSRLAETHQVVVVSVNYRLGPFGWFSHPAFRSTGRTELDASSNYGTLDLIAALKWVQANIGAFGGDRNNVTIFGESAGGLNVLTLMASELSAGLFHKAISQSGGLFVSSLEQGENYIDDSTPGHPFSSQEAVNLLLVKDGRAPDRASAKAIQQKMSAAEIVDYLYGQEFDELFSVYQGSLGGMLDIPAVFGDGYVLPKNINEAAVFGNQDGYNQTPVMLGTNRDEVKLFMLMSGEATKSFFGIPYGLKDPDFYNIVARYSSDNWKAGGVDELALNFDKHQPGSVYAYRFDWDEQKSVFGFDFAEVLGAAHGLEIAFVFGNFGGGFGFDFYPEDGLPSRDALSASMMSYWAEFAHSGNPGRGRDGSEVAWLPWKSDPAEERVLILDTSRDAGIRMSNVLVTRNLVRDRFLADSRLQGESRCTAYRQIYRDDFVQSEYESMGCSL